MTSSPDSPVQEQDARGTRGWAIQRPASRPSRLILDFYPISWCGDGVGLTDHDRARVPPPLLQRGVTQEIWVEWVHKLQTSVQSRTPCCGVFGCLLSATFLFPLICWCHQNNRYQDALSLWLQQFNESVLMPRGMFAATQTAEYDVHYSDGNQSKHYHEEISWLAIATTPEEVEKLRTEPHIWRFYHGCPCCVPCCPEGWCYPEDTIAPQGECHQHTCCCCCSLPRMV
eukprot:TRINITY_DN5654_c0_g1_i2.p1 TRINITY_DN5654_c0_g1~~TRINITY_DN5654_c0_g1_i2.p1  ORF type:complete len:228 (+),score=18.44 TRINITY_DN5654_c0_g1_i2:422-1105(+)